MIDEFAIYARLGFHHIADLAGYDHLLFIVALSIPYGPRDWRRLAVLVTAFTVGHSATLALATLRLVSVPSALVELLIPVTIVLTAVLAWREIGDDRPADAHGRPSSWGASVSLRRSRSAMAATFGLVHGLGFSSYLRSLLGQEESILLPLLGFNIGLEAAQLVVLASVLATGAVAMRTPLGPRRWRQALVVVTAALALMLVVQRL